MPSHHDATIYFLQDYKLKLVDDIPGDSFPEPEDGIRQIYFLTNNMFFVAVSTFWL